MAVHPGAQGDHVGGFQISWAWACALPWLRAAHATSLSMRRHAPPCPCPPMPMRRDQSPTRLPRGAVPGAVRARCRHRRRGVGAAWARTGAEQQRRRCGGGAAAGAGGQGARARGFPLGPRLCPPMSHRTRPPPPLTSPLPRPPPQLNPNTYPPEQHSPQKVGGMSNSQRHGSGTGSFGAAQHHSPSGSPMAGGAGGSPGSFSNRAGGRFSNSGHVSRWFR
jgi:hypothetical protein